MAERDGTSGFNVQTRPNVRSRRASTSNAHRFTTVVSRIRFWFLIPQLTVPWPSGISVPDSRGSRTWALPWDAL